MTADDEVPAVPDDAPPAILFRLSYRANANLRSGYRPGDDRDRVVASVRGWWELDPDEVKSLNIKYAVAFHRGVTRAVVAIGSWKWQDVPGSDHNAFDATDSAADTFCAYHHCGCGSRETTRAVPVSENHASSRRPSATAERQSTPLSPAS